MKPLKYIVAGLICLSTSLAVADKMTTKDQMSEEIGYKVYSDKLMGVVVNNRGCLQFAVTN